MIQTRTQVTLPMVAEAGAFWNTKSLAEMTTEEWESLCDGCGRCCLHKLQDEDSGLLFYTNVACRQLDRQHCRCRNYPQRLTIVPDCLALAADDQDRFGWLPSSCAYRRLANGQSLDWWHPLLSGDPDTVHQAGISVRGRTVPEDNVPREQFEDHIIHWIDF
jgi:uncharacterized cysteine cluster protein YcgN (CxxCxxCC family)